MSSSTSPQRPSACGLPSQARTFVVNQSLVEHGAEIARRNRVAAQAVFAPIRRHALGQHFQPRPWRPCRARYWCARVRSGTEPMLTILPFPRGIIFRATADRRKTRCRDCFRINSRHVSTGKSSSGVRRWMPALLTRISIGRLRIRFCHSRRDRRGSVTSKTAACAVAPRIFLAPRRRPRPSRVAPVDDEGCARACEPFRERKPMPADESGHQRDGAGIANSRSISAVKMFPLRRTSPP